MILSKRTGLFGRTVLKWVRGIRLERVDWIREARYRDQWRFLTNTAIISSFLPCEEFLQ